MMRAKEFKTQGKVYLVGAGPGDPELLTLKAARILGRADVVLHDALVSRGVLELVAKNAERIDVGKRCGQKLLTQEEINALLISYAKSNDIVVRLKGGDPLIFGRAGEEMEALRGAGVDFEVVPGITAAMGAAAVARISLTDRRAASQVLITTAHRVREGTETDWSRVTSTTTLVIYMPGPTTNTLRGSCTRAAGRRICPAPSSLPRRRRINKSVGATSQRLPLSQCCRRQHC